MSLETLFKTSVKSLTNHWQGWIDYFQRAGFTQAHTNEFALNHIYMAQFVDTFYLLYVADSAYYVYMGEEEMAKQFSMEFVNHTLTETEAVQFSKWLTSFQKDEGDPATELLMQGYKVSARYVADQAAVVVTVIGTDETPDNKNKAMSSWAENLYEGFAIALFKVAVVFKNGEWDTGKASKRWG